jgi:hypothetical protein
VELKDVRAVAGARRSDSYEMNEGLEVALEGITGLGEFRNNKWVKSQPVPDWNLTVDYSTGLFTGGGR